ncbi:hypothetical protein N8500_06410 [Candidatus Puniceispirillum sp.]|nr:hypothetical protein [Candidatus Puniceispirillum sp.]
MTNSEVQTGVQSAGWQNSSTHWPTNSDKHTDPIVERAAKLITVDPINDLFTVGKICRVCAFESYILHTLFNGIILIR